MRDSDLSEVLQIPIERDALSEEKAHVRRLVCERLAGLSPEARRARSARLIAILENHPEFQAARRVFAYRGLPDEPDLRALQIQSREIFYPVITRTETGALMQFFPAKDGAFRLGAYGIEEPEMDFSPTLPTGEDVVLLPGRAFTSAGLRLGRGGGFYDRFFASLPPEDFPFLIGICFREQLFPSLPVGCHDFPVNAVLAA
jgi:5-formyltetrahydrofolate cyclo-ligase